MKWVAGLRKFPLIGDLLFVDLAHKRKPLLGSKTGHSLIFRLEIPFVCFKAFKVIKTSRKELITLERVLAHGSNHKKWKPIAYIGGCGDWYLLDVMKNCLCVQTWFLKTYYLAYEILNFLVSTIYLKLKVSTLCVLSGFELWSQFQYFSKHQSLL